MVDFSSSNNVFQDFPVEESYSKQIVNQVRGNVDAISSSPYTETANVQPLIYDFIGKNNFNGRDVPGFHAIDKHNLKVGDYVEITNGDQNYVGTYQVVKTSADDGTYEGTIFLIDTPYVGGGDGTFKKTDKIIKPDSGVSYFAPPFDDLKVIPKNTNPVNFYGNKYLRFGEYVASRIPVGVDAAKFISDSGEDTNGYTLKAYNDFINSQSDSPGPYTTTTTTKSPGPSNSGSQKDTTGPSNITYYVIGGVALLSLILILRK